MQTAISIYLFIIGLCFGSFALAMVDRMKAKKDWVKGRSKCDFCKHKLSVIDLIPILSWLSTAGKCRYCKKKLSVFYPLVELFTGLAFLFSYLYFPYEISGLALSLFVIWLFGLVLMSALIVFDIRWYLLPNKLVYPLIYTALAYRIISYFVNTQGLIEAITATILSLLVSAGLFWFLHVVSDGKWIGDGDVRLGVAIGLFLANPFLAWLCLFFASMLGLILALPMLIHSKKKLKLKIPFGPFLILGLYFSFLFGQSLLDWYTSTFLYL